MSDAPIGIYDSGFGGLTVWREIRHALPNESLVYLGDGKNCPYGSLSEERVREVLDPIIAAGADIIVLGCTHYPFLRPVIEKVVGGRGIEVIDSGAAVEKRVESLLDEYGLRAPEGHAAAYRFLSMAGREYCERLCRKALSGDGCAREK